MRELAARLGIQTSYLDMGGKEHWAAPETLQALFELWGIAARSEKEAREALREQERESWQDPLEPVVVVWEGKPFQVHLKLPGGFENSAAKALLRLESGNLRKLDISPDRLRTRRRVSLDGSTWFLKQLPCPALPLGYHELIFEIGGRRSTSLVIVAPRRSYSPPEAIRSLGLFLPMYAAHSQSSWGAGHLGDWERLGNWAASVGADVLSTLPLTAAFLKEPLCDPSPYAPASRLFWNEFYLDIERLPEFSRCHAAQRLVNSAPFQARLCQFRAAPEIDYSAQAAARREVLELLAKSFFAHSGPRRRDFESFLREHPALGDYARFRAVTEKSGTSWHQWPQRLKQGVIEDGDYDIQAEHYHLYAQWHAERQIGGLIQRFRGRGLEMYLDLPVGVHPDSYDVWRGRDAFAFPASVGAPPDLFFTKGQNWGFAPLHPARLREQRYRYFIEFLRFQMKHVGMLRMDHVMGLHRLYWIPPGLPATQGAYVRYPAEELHAILSLESHRNHTVMVGENLGTVPPEVTKAMSTHGIREIFVVQFELNPNPRNAVRKPPVRSVASLNTHDMPTFAAHWAKADLEDRMDLGLLKPAELRKTARLRDRLNNALAAFLGVKGDPESKAVLRACLKWLASGPAEVVQLNLEDLWGELRPQNVPGTSVERPNWRRKAKLTLEDIQNSRELAELVKCLARLRSDLGRHAFGPHRG